MAETKQDLINKRDNYQSQVTAKRNKISTLKKQRDRLDEAIKKLKLYRDSLDDDKDGFNRTYIEGEWDWRGCMASGFVSDVINNKVEKSYSTVAKRINSCMGELEKAKSNIGSQISELSNPLSWLDSMIADLSHQIASWVD